MDTETPDLLPELLRCESADHSLGWRALWIAGAVVCFVAGVVGWLVPVITGVPFYIAGLVLLAKAVPPVGHKVNEWERRLPLKWRLVLRPKYRRWRKELALAEALARKKKEAGEDPPAPDDGQASAGGLATDEGLAMDDTPAPNQGPSAASADATSHGGPRPPEGGQAAPPERPEPRAD